MDRREFLIRTGATLGATWFGRRSGGTEIQEPTDPMTLFLCGDVMTGRGIDQLLPHPSDPAIFEPYVKNASRYVELAEELNGPIARPVAFSYIWGEALDELARQRPDARIVNLETAVTRSDDRWREKQIHYRMHPANVGCLSAAKIDCCVLANNHVLDWGYQGLTETLASLRQARLTTAGAGRDRQEAAAPAILEVPGKGRVIVVALGSPTSGIPLQWAAADDRAGVNLLPALSEDGVRQIASQIEAVKRPGDRVVASIHWGSNWGYSVPPSHQWFARQLIDRAGVDVVHGHSSHHPLAIEVYRQRPILYGCGDFLNDYEGIEGYSQFRGDLVLAYFVSLDRITGELVQLVMTLFQSQRLRLQAASSGDVAWMRDTLNREGRAFDSRVEVRDSNTLELRWGQRG